MTASHTPASPLLDGHRSLGATLIDFAGWAMPLKYGSELAEHRVVRERAGLFDLSHMGEIAVTGTQSAEALDFALAGQAAKIPVGLDDTTPTSMTSPPSRR
jgi:aminomethyltransferase